MLHGPIFDRVGFSIGRGTSDLNGALVVERVEELIASVAKHVSLEILANVALVRLSSALTLFVSCLVGVTAVDWDVSLIAWDECSASGCAVGQVAPL